MIQEINEEIDEEQVKKEFEVELLKAIATYEVIKHTKFPQLDIFINDKVWESIEKYTRMEITTKEKFFESLLNNKSVEEYSKELKELWDIDHSYMNKAIEELQKMVIQKDFKNAEMYLDKKVVSRSVKLQNTYYIYKMKKEKMYKLNPERDFRTMEQRFVNRHIKLYTSMKKRLEKSKNVEETLSNFMKTYDRLDRTIPYFAHNDIISKTTGEVIHKAGDIIRYVDVSTYNSMLYNVNLTRSAWNRTFYDAMLFGINLFYLVPHPFACEHCMEYQGYVYAENNPSIEEQYVLRKYGKPGAFTMDKAINGGVGHPNCSHQWTPYYSQEQIQEDKYNSSEWIEKYKTKQKIQSIDLQKSRLLADRRIYKELGKQDLVDKTTPKIKRLREKKKELEALL